MKQRTGSGMGRRVLAMLLAAVMCLGLLPGAAFAQEGAKSAGPLKDGARVVIYNPAGKKALSTQYRGFFNQGVDVTLEKDGTLSGWTEDEVWTVGVQEDGSYTFSAGETGQLSMEDSFSSTPLTGANRTWTLTAVPGQEGRYFVENTGRTGRRLQWNGDMDRWEGGTGEDESVWQALYVLPEEPGGKTPEILAAWALREPFEAIGETERRPYHTYGAMQFHAGGQTVSVERQEGQNQVNLEVPAGTEVTAAISLWTHHAVTGWIVYTGAKFDGTAYTWTGEERYQPGPYDREKGGYTVTFSMPESSVIVVPCIRVKTFAPVYLRCGGRALAGNGKLNLEFQFPTAVAAGLPAPDGESLFAGWYEAGKEETVYAPGDRIASLTVERLDCSGPVLLYQLGAKWTKDPAARLLTVDTQGGGTYTLSCDSDRACLAAGEEPDRYQIPAGAQVTLSFTPTGDQTLDHWEVNGAPVSGDSFSMPDDTEGAVLRAVLKDGPDGDTEPADYYLRFDETDGKLYKQYAGDAAPVLYRGQPDRWSARDDDGDGKFETLVLKGLRFRCTGYPLENTPLYGALRLPDDAVLEVQGENEISAELAGKYWIDGVLAGKRLTIAGGGTLRVKAKKTGGQLNTVTALQADALTIRGDTTVEFTAESAHDQHRVQGLELQKALTVEPGSTLRILAQRNGSPAAAIIGQAILRAPGAQVTGAAETFVSGTGGTLTQAAADVPVEFRDRETAGGVHKILAIMGRGQITAEGGTARDLFYLSSHGALTMTVGERSETWTQRRWIWPDWEIPAGQQVTVKLEAVDGFRVRHWTVGTNAKEKTIGSYIYDETATVPEANTFTFTMPDCDLVLVPNFAVEDGARVRVGGYQSSYEEKNALGYGQVGGTFSLPTALEVNLRAGKENEVFTGWQVWDTVTWNSQGMPEQITMRPCQPGESIPLEKDRIISDNQELLLVALPGDGGTSEDVRILTVETGGRGTYTIGSSDSRAMGASTKNLDQYHIPKGAAVTLSFTAEEGYLFDHWELNQKTITGNSFVMPDGAATVRAVCRVDPEKTKVTAPAAVSGLVYTGKTQSGLTGGSGYGYVLSGQTEAADAGTYTAEAALEDGFAWADGEGDRTKTISWSIARQTQKAPEGLRVTAVSTTTGLGSVEGTTQDMEYRLVPDGAWKPCTQTRTVLPAGIYEIRYAGDRNREASPAATAKLPFAGIPVYNITVETDGNGTASASCISSSAGQEIALTAQPKAGYAFDRWEVVSPADLNIAEDGFTMPSADVTVKAWFRVLPVEFQLNQTGVYDFGTLTVGYTQEDLKPLTVTITNTGRVPTGELTVEVGEHLQIVGTGRIASIPAGGQDTFQVRPKTGLPVGFYSGRVTVTAGEAARYFQTTLEVVNRKQAATPVITPDGGSFRRSQTVTIACATENAEIYYTTDGTDPLNVSTAKRYAGPFTITESAAVKAAAKRSDLRDSDLAEASFTRLPDPVLGGQAAIRGTARYGQSLTADTSGITGNTGKLSYQWNRDGAAIPGAMEARYTVAEADIGRTLTVTITSDTAVGSVTSGGVTAQKAEGPEAPKVTGVTCTTPENQDGAITGVDETMEYARGILAAKTPVTGTRITGLTPGTYFVRWKETATREAGIFAVVEVPAYEAPQTVEMPVIQPNGGSFTGTQTVTITCATRGAKIYYTIDGSDPEQSGTAYTGPFVLRASATVRAYAEAEGLTPSAQAAAEFTKTAPASGGGSASTGTVTAPRAEGGSVSTDTDRARPGSTVTITVTPDAGYETGEVTVVDRNGNKLTVTDRGGGKFSFTMPAGGVEIQTEFLRKPALSFRDVAEGAYYEPAVAWAVGSGVATGKTLDLFGTGEGCTRAQIVAFLWRAAGSPEPKAPAAMTDVPTEAYYAKAAAWAAETGVTAGVAEGRFDPDAICTRAQAVTLLYRAFGEPETKSGGFADVPAEAYYAKAAAWAAAEGIAQGVADGQFAPERPCKREEIVTLLYRAYGPKS